MTKYAVKVVEIRDGAKTFDQKEILKADGFKWMEAPSIGYSKAWVKEVASVDEACDVIKKLADKRFGSEFGIIDNGKYCYISDAIEKKPDDVAELKEAKKAVYLFRKANKIY